MPLTLISLPLPIGVTVSLPRAGVLAISRLDADTHPLAYQGAFDAIGMADQVEAHCKACDALEAAMIEVDDGKTPHAPLESLAAQVSETAVPLHAVVAAAHQALSTDEG